MKASVEYTGMAKSIAGTQQETIDMEQGSTYNNLIAELANRHPDLVGPFISAENNVLLSSTVLVRSDGDLITYERMHEPIQDGEHLVLLTLIVGG